MFVKGGGQVGRVRILPPSKESGRCGALHTKIRYIILFLAACSFISPSLGDAFEDDIENDLQKDLGRSKVLVAQIKSKLSHGASVTSELTQLKSTADDIRASTLLLDERFSLRSEKAKTLGTKALERHETMVEGYKKALTEYLGLIDSLPPDNAILRSVFDELKALLDKILPSKKHPIIGSLPYKHLNYPAQEPSTAPSITPAYLGGNKTVSPDDTAAAPEAPVSNEIATLAQSLNWNPVSIYEYVKNNIETEWYWGCMKGAEDTLHQKSGNDCDQAALLTALLRASGFPTRYVRGVIQFFPDIERTKNLTGIDDPAKIAEFFQKAGIPYMPVIAGGTISNIQVEHVWVESLIPYSNYRGAVIDANGKTWLGLDTSVKVKGYTYNNAPDLLEDAGISSQLSGVRDAYLGIVSFGTGSTPLELKQTPLEYLQSRINAELETQNSQLRYADLQRSRELVPEVLNILPASTQFTLIKATNEYTRVPDELLHQIRFAATDLNKNELFTITLPSYKLSNQQIAVSYEPETVQDQKIIDSYGGLDNTPAYLVRLRPILKISNQQSVVGKDGLPMGSEYDLNVELQVPGAGSTAEKIRNTHIVGNLCTIGIVAQKAVSNQLSAESSELNAEGLLFQEAQNYIDRWNKSEDELASLFHLTIARPIPTVVTLGGVIDVTYLMGMPHGITWKGDFVDASLRAVEVITRTEDPDNWTRLFMQFSSLQGSVLEHKIFEDDWRVTGVSTAKLIQIANQGAGLINIDGSDIDTVLPTLPVDDSIKEDIINSVNQNQTIRIPKSAMVYQDWSGIGYVKEDPDTGESGWMLSGSIAGGMTAVSPGKWTSQDNETVLSNPYNDDSRNIYITSPANETTVSTPVITVTGYVLDPEATVTVNGVPAIVQDAVFTATITLKSGTNTIRATATNKAGKTSFDMIVIRYKIPLAIAITYPFEGADLAMSPIYVEGFVSDPAASLYVNGTKTQPTSDGHFLINGVQLTEGANQIIASAMNTDGDLASQTITVNYHTPQTQPSLVINITTPINGVTINKPSTTVIGTITSTADEFWVMVNGMPAVIYGDQFVVNNVPLTNGSTRIIVNAMNSNGAIGRAEISVTTNMTEPYVQLSANIQSGTSPLNTYFTVNTNTTGMITGYQLDFGDGSAHYSSASFDDVVHTYTAEGVFHPVLTITDSMGNVYIDTLALTVLNKTKLNAALTSKWNGMKAKLVNQDINGALAYFSSISQDRYRDIFTTLNPDLPQIALEMQDIEMIYAINKMAKYRIRANELYGGQNLEITYYIYFEVNEYGAWRIRLF